MWHTPSDISTFASLASHDPVTTIFLHSRVTRLCENILTLSPTMNYLVRLTKSVKPPLHCEPYRRKKLTSNWLCTRSLGSDSYRHKTCFWHWWSKRWNCWQAIRFKKVFRQVSTRPRCVHAEIVPKTNMSFRETLSFANAVHGFILGNMYVIVRHSRPC